MECLGIWTWGKLSKWIYRMWSVYAVSPSAGEGPSVLRVAWHHARSSAIGSGSRRASACSGWTSTAFHKGSQCAVSSWIMWSECRNQMPSNGNYYKLCRILTNRSSTSMLCCYASAAHPYVYLQRGYRNYGTPNVHLSLSFIVIAASTNVNNRAHIRLLHPLLA